MYIPTKVSVTFNKIFIPARRNSVFFNKLKVSKENVEKVVKPPQKPTPIKKLKVLNLNYRVRQIQKLKIPK